MTIPNQHDSSDPRHRGEPTTSAGLVFFCLVFSAAPLFWFMSFLPTEVMLLNTPPRSPFMYDVTAPKAPIPASLKKLGSLILPDVSYMYGRSRADPEWQAVEMRPSAVVHLHCRMSRGSCRSTHNRRWQSTGSLQAEGGP